MDVVKMKTTTKKIAKSLLDIGAVGFNVKNPITFKSGLKSPVYVDNRVFPSHPKEWALVIDGFKQLLKAKNITFDVIAGIESAGIPHSAALGFSLKKPSVFVRKQKKAHGTKKGVEGGSVEGKKVLLIEDHITTGGSSLRGAESLKMAGAEVIDCFAITTYGFLEANEAFSAAGVVLHTLTTFEAILTEAVARGLLTNKEKTIVQDWFDNPHGWAEKQ